MAQDSPIPQRAPLIREPRCPSSMPLALLLSLKFHLPRPGEGREEAPSLGDLAAAMEAVMPDPELCGTHSPHLCEEAVKELLLARPCWVTSSWSLFPAAGFQAYGPRRVKCLGCPWVAAVSPGPPGDPMPLTRGWLSW